MPGQNGRTSLDAADCAPLAAAPRPEALLLHRRAALLASAQPSATKPIATIAQLQSAVEAREERIQDLERALDAATASHTRQEAQLAASCSAKLQQLRALHAEQLAASEARAQAAAEEAAALRAQLLQQRDAAISQRELQWRQAVDSGQVAGALAEMEEQLARLSAALRSRDAEIGSLRCALAAAGSAER